MTPIKKAVLGLVAATLAAAGAPAALKAQQKSVELTLFGGSHLPIEKDGEQNGNVDLTRRPSLLGGARLTYWVSNALGIEAAGAFSPADVRQRAAGGSVFSRSTDLFVGSAKLALNLTPNRGGLSVLLNGGAALLRYGKTAADPDLAESEIGGVAGVALKLPIGTNVGIRGDAEGFIYSTDFGLGKKTVQDVVLSAGLVIRF